VERSNLVDFAISIVRVCNDTDRAEFRRRAEQ